MVRASFAWLALPLGCLAAASEPFKCIMYLTGQHPITPPREAVRHVTHVEMAFLPSDLFNRPPPDEYPLFMSVSEARTHFRPGTQIMVAIGGWGDTLGFEKAASTAQTRKLWSGNVAAMVETTGADGVDLDWEYPGGNGEHYKVDPNSGKAWEIEAYPLLIQALRDALGPRKLISAAVPGLERDMIAFTGATVPQISQNLDFINVMTYDLMNRRDNATKHHTGVEASRESLKAYIDRGAPAAKLNLGFAFYVKWFLTEECDPTDPVGCRTGLMEDRKTGADLGKTGGFSWHDSTPEDVKASFSRALELGEFTTSGGGGYSYWDAAEQRWWTFDTPEVVPLKFQSLVDGSGIGGVFAWGLGEDGPRFAMLGAVNAELDKRARTEGQRDEL
ncbi:hypothetical protein BROUX41_006018 [Berkeleyomyces rouxiae]